MKPSELKLLLARLLGLTAVFCGLIGLIIGIVDWFTGGTLLAVLALFRLGWIRTWCSDARRCSDRGPSIPASAPPLE